MELGELAKKTTARICAEVPAAMTADEEGKVSTIIEKAIIEAVLATSARCRDVAVVCCGPEADMAHKIADEVKRAQIALIANLGGMR